MTNSPIRYLLAVRTLLTLAPMQFKACARSKNYIFLFIYSVLWASQLNAKKSKIIRFRLKCYNL